MKTLLLLAGTLMTQTLVSQLLTKTVQPAAKSAARMGVKYSAKVFSICLIGGLSVSAGLVMGFSDIANQMSDVGFVRFSPMVGLSLALFSIGIFFVYLGAFSNWLLPWKEASSEQTNVGLEGSFAILAESLLLQLANATRPKPSHTEFDQQENLGKGLSRRSDSDPRQSQVEKSTPETSMVH
ncbi:hypothetical protein GW916_12000 [bacterium]|nr:hypothetical protein [bacterium]